MNEDPYRQASYPVGGLSYLDLFFNQSQRHLRKSFEKKLRKGARKSIKQFEKARHGIRQTMGITAQPEDKLQQDDHELCELLEARFLGEHCGTDYMSAAEKADVRRRWHNIFKRMVEKRHILEKFGSIQPKYDGSDKSIYVLRFRERDKNGLHHRSIHLGSNRLLLRMVIEALRCFRIARKIKEKKDRVVEEL